MWRVQGAGCGLLGMAADLMSTSGVYRSWVDLDIECRCGFEGSTLACEDTEDTSFSWSCPGCGWETTEELR